MLCDIKSVIDIRVPNPWAADGPAQQQVSGKPVSRAAAVFTAPHRSQYLLSSSSRQASSDMRFS